MNEKTLYIFDLDGTLVEKWGVALLPGVPEKLIALVRANRTLAVATNQAGIAWGAMTQAEKYPTPATLGPRFDEIALRLPSLERAPWFVSIYDKRVRLSEKRYGILVKALKHASQTLDLRVSAEPSWRKPLPGMLLAAAACYGTTPDSAVFIGDMDSDREAAEAAGMDYANVADFFR